MATNTSRLIAILAAAVVLAVAFFAGFMVENSARKSDAAEAAAQIEGLNTQIQDATKRADSLESRNHLLAADVLTYRAADALDKRNFGVASETLEQAVAELGQVDATEAGLDPAGLTAVRTQAASVKIEVGTNLEEQHSALLALATNIKTLSDAAVEP